jgi:hypothetical protein
VKAHDCVVSKHAVLRYLERVDPECKPERVKAELKHHLKQVRVQANAPPGATWYTQCTIDGHRVQVTVAWHPDRRCLVAVTVVGLEASA